ncbi:MAG: hypothetical protein ACREDL_02705 [Bradyrhizobium sp.]
MVWLAIAAPRRRREDRRHFGFQTGEGEDDLVVTAPEDCDALSCNIAEPLELDRMQRE